MMCVVCVLCVCLRVSLKVFVWYMWMIASWWMACCFCLCVFVRLSVCVSFMCLCVVCDVLCGVVWIVSVCCVYFCV